MARLDLQLRRKFGNGPSDLPMVTKNKNDDDVIINLNSGERKVVEWEDVMYCVKDDLDLGDCLIAKVIISEVS